MRNRRIWGLFAFFLFIFIGMNTKVPYYIYQPGSALPLAPIIQVEDGYAEEQGTFRLTTIRTGPTNVAGALWASLDANAELVKAEHVHSPHESNEQYLQRQLAVMKASQDTAKIVAFQKAGFDIKLKNSGAIIMQIIPGYPAEKVLQVGDVIFRVDDVQIETAEDLMDALKGRQVNEETLIHFARDGKPQAAKLTLTSLPALPGEESKPGIGIASPITKRVFELPKNVEIKSAEIGGPSAGLMFTLEMMNQLLPGDLTKGYDIAGTGTINEDGSIGRIGGIEYKVVAAAREQTEIFFAPAEKDEKGVSNYDQAIKKAKSQNLKMKIIAVREIDDVLDYLKKLPPR
ncbi:hypothetical protein BEP19_07075 [Ammoniphilus oxalaticus]|uniref:endopeptidase La n=1 Tax=Ammoniphilus oxalaticus TaxID=66863 RepID=A0A419SJM4_9BACL|nr:SepM family pheromone-processing serine protease [Ammoniphilus oxalaticus]RKD24162.1 hypothetical protein BEP19_07075 [Ammoniphilus oxalaticus]